MGIPRPAQDLQLCVCQLWQRQTSLWQALRRTTVRLWYFSNPANFTPLPNSNSLCRVGKLLADIHADCDMWTCDRLKHLYPWMTSSQDLSKSFSFSSKSFEIQSSDLQFYFWSLIFWLLQFDPNSNRSSVHPLMIWTNPSRPNAKLSLLIKISKFVYWLMLLHFWIATFFLCLFSNQILLCIHWRANCKIPTHLPPLLIWQ